MYFLHWGAKVAVIADCRFKIADLRKILQERIEISDVGFVDVLLPDWIVQAGICRPLL
jgi:hypothetical protein